MQLAHKRHIKSVFHHMYILRHPQSDESTVHFINKLPRLCAILFANRFSCELPHAQGSPYLSFVLLSGDW